MDHSKHEHSRSSVGLAVIRCSLCFVFVIVFIPILTTLMVLRDNDNPGISIWWLQPVDVEDLIEEESEQLIATQLKLRKWAKKQKELALAFVSAGTWLSLLSSVSRVVFSRSDCNLFVVILVDVVALFLTCYYSVEPDYDLLSIRIIQELILCLRTIPQAPSCPINNIVEFWGTHGMGCSVGKKWCDDHLDHFSPILHRYCLVLF